MAIVLNNFAAGKLYLNEELADVHFLFNLKGEIQQVPAHKANLAIISPVFKTMFYGSLKEKDEVLITDADVDGFKEFLQFFYRGEVTLSMEHIETVVRMADKYDVLDCVNASVAFPENQLTIENICWGYQLALNLKNDDLIRLCEEKISESLNEVFATEAFQRCNKSILERILKLKFVCKETDIYDACIRWAKHACEKDDLDGTDAVNLKTQLGDCLKLIPFGSMEINEFSKRYMLHKGLFTSEEFEDIILSISVKKYEPKIFNQSPNRYLWDAANVLRCERKTEVVYPKKNIQTIEVTSFSSNKYVLLGGINTARTYAGSSSIVGTEVEVTITEQRDAALHFTVSPKVLYQDTCKTWGGDDAQLLMTLPQPILIKPGVIYDIQLKLPSTNWCQYYYSDCKQTVEMANGIKIQFHRNPTLNYDNQAIGWIADLLFNEV